jgi:hypothetical protein
MVISCVLAGIEKKNRRTRKQKKTRRKKKEKKQKHRKERRVKAGPSEGRVRVWWCNPLPPLSLSSLLNSPSSSPTPHSHTTP